MRIRQMRLEQRGSAATALRFFQTLLLSAVLVWLNVVLATTSTLAQQNDTIRSTIDRRCVVCHGCYDGPCQFRMSSDQGLLRGANKERIYEPSRLTEAPLTRLGIDATTVEQWRDLGFFDVLHGSGDQRSVLERMLALGRAHPLPQNEPLPKAIDLDIKRKLACPAPAEMLRYETRTPLGGMPYGTAPLSDIEWKQLSDWIEAGSPPLQRPLTLDTELVANVAAWEKFLNGTDNRSKLVARYIYEHLFIAHLYIPGFPGVYFELVRSKTPPGTPIDVVATRRPYDDPGTTEVYYRLRPINETILHKTHIVYRFGSDRLERYRDLFFASQWPVTSLPSYEPAIASNPFATFAAIPAEARYRFLLDDADYVIRTFIRGPVCHGQVAVNVIEDRFWVSFLAPDADLSVTDPAYLAEVTPFLGLPAAQVERPLLERLVPDYLTHNRRYTDLRRKRYAEADPSKSGPSIDAIWPGQAGAGATVLTVFRHFDNATVVGGFIGDTPETAWVIDFPILERIYYNLVAGFDVFGPVEHQLSTRIYMDLLRMEGEDLFLSFLPADIRRPLHNAWYRGGRAKVRFVYLRPPVDIETGTRVEYTTDDPKAELLSKALNRDTSVAIKTDPLNRSDEDRSSLPESLKSLARLSSIRAPWVRQLPDVMLLQIRGDDDRVVTFVRNKAHTNVAHLFAEDLRREPRKDTVTLIDGPLGSYPNFFFVVDKADLPKFISQLEAVATKADWHTLIGDFGIRRTSPDFWRTADFFQDRMATEPPTATGLLDLNRYKDP